MKFNFKKVSSVLASLAMVGSTVGVAMAANYPAPFVEGGASDVAIVVGSNQNAMDLSAASSIGSDLTTALSGQTVSGDGGTTSVSGGDSFEIALASTKLNIAQALTDVVTGTIQAADMPNLLADGSITGKSNSVEYKYTQEIKLYPALNYTSFRDKDHDGNKASIGIKISQNTHVMNYTISWTKSPKSEVSSASRLTNLEDIPITIMGKEYTILNAYENTSATNGTKFDLMGGAETGTINSGETQTITLDGHTYALRINFIDSSNTKICVSVDGGAEEKCSTELSEGSTTSLSDDTQLGVRGINYQGYSGGIQSVDWSLGAKKLVIQDGQTASLNGEDINGLTVECDSSDSGDSSYPVQIGDIVFTWKAKDEQFISEAESVTLPGLETVKIQAGSFYTPAQETITIDNDGDDTMQITMPITDGEVTIPLLYANGSTWSHVGEDSDKILAVNHTVLLWNGSEKDDVNANSTGDHVAFIATWNSSTDFESYYLTADMTQESSGLINYTNIYNLVTDPEKTSPICTTKASSNCKIGNVVITPSAINYDDESAILSGGTSVSFNKLFSAEGLAIDLPKFRSTTGLNFSDGNGINPSATNSSGFYPYLNTSYDLYMYEEDKDGNLQSGNTIAVRLAYRSGKAEVTDVDTTQWADSSSITKTKPNLETEPDSDEYQSYAGSKLATKALYKKPDNGQYSLELTYHGGESYGQVFVTAPETSVTVTTDGTTTSSFVSITDAEITSADQAKNLVVVGGSCINTVAAKLLGSDTPLCEADFTAQTEVGAGEWIIKTFNSPYTTGQVAMLVAGYGASDTSNAATYLTTTSDAVSTAVGEGKTGSDSVTATSIVA